MAKIVIFTMSLTVADGDQSDPMIESYSKNVLISLFNNIKPINNGKR